MGNFNVVEIDNEFLDVKNKKIKNEANIENIAIEQPEQYLFSVNFINGIENMGDKSLWISLDDAKWREVKPGQTILSNVSMEVASFKIRSEFGLVPFNAKGVTV